jgi:hypothetical protein
MSLTNEQKNIKIAEACGWTDIRYTGGLILPRHLTGCIPNDSQRLPIPNYCGSLDAMHEAEKILGPRCGDTYSTYHSYLRTMTSSTLHAASSPAMTRAIAFGITLKLWTQEEWLASRDLVKNDSTSKNHSIT